MERPIFRAILRAISIRPCWRPTWASRRARRMISSRSASVSCRNRVPRSTCSLVSVDEPLEARLEEPDLRPPLDEEAAGDQSLRPPAVDGPGRDVVATADGVDRQDRLGDLLELLADRRREVLDEQPEVVLDVGPLEHQGREPLGAEPRDPEAEILVRIALLGRRSPPAAPRRGRSARAGGPWGRTGPAAPSVASGPGAGTCSPSPGRRPRPGRGPGRRAGSPLRPAPNPRGIRCLRPESCVATRPLIYRRPPTGWVRSTTHAHYAKSMPLGRAKSRSSSDSETTDVGRPRPTHKLHDEGPRKWRPDPVRSTHIPADRLTLGPPRPHHADSGCRMEHSLDAARPIIVRKNFGCMHRRVDPGCREGVRLNGKWYGTAELTVICQT